MEKRGTCSANLGPLGYVWDQLPLAQRAAYRAHVCLDESRVLGFEYALGLAGIGAVITPDPAKPPSHDAIRNYIHNHDLPVLRPLPGMGLPGRIQAIAPLCWLLVWADKHLGGHRAHGLRPLTRDEVD